MANRAGLKKDWSISRTAHLRLELRWCNVEFSLNAIIHLIFYIFSYLNRRFHGGKYHNGTSGRQVFH